MGASGLNSFLDRVESRDDPALWHRDGAEWSAGEGSPGRDVRELAAALAGFGLVPGRAAVVLADEGPDACRASLAVLAAGGCLVRLAGATAGPRLLDILSASDAVVAIVETKDQLARVLDMRPELPSLELVILLAEEAGERKTAALLVGRAVEIGAARLAEDPEVLVRARAAATPSTPVLLVASEGLRRVSAETLAGAADRIADALSLAPGRTLLSALPADAPESIAAILGALGRGATLLATAPDGRIDVGLAQRAPDAALVSKEAIDGLYRAWQSEIEARSWPARKAYVWALLHGADATPRTWRNRLADLFVLARIRARWGSRLTRWGVVERRTGHAETAFFAAVGTPLYVVRGVA